MSTDMEEGKSQGTEMWLEIRTSSLGVPALFPLGSSSIDHRNSVIIPSDEVVALSDIPMEVGEDFTIGNEAIGLYLGEGPDGSFRVRVGNEEIPFNRLTDMGVRVRLVGRPRPPAQDAGFD